MSGSTEVQSIPSFPNAPVSPLSDTVSDQTFSHSEDSNFMNVTIFDWDDTLLSSTWLSQIGLSLDSEEIPAEIKEQLESLEKAVVALLSKALSIGPVYVITNAGYGWVEMSANKFLPSVSKLLPLIRIISARALYEPYYPNSPMYWKRCTFQYELGLLYNLVNNKVFNIISFGDSPSERFATNTLELNCQMWKKFIQFRERLHPAQMTQAINYILSQIDDLVNKRENLDLLLFM